MRTAWAVAPLLALALAACSSDGPAGLAAGSGDAGVTAGHTAAPSAKLAATVTRDEAVDRACHAFFLAGMSYSKEWEAVGCANAHYNSYAFDPTEFRVFSLGDPIAVPERPTGDVLFDFSQDILPDEGHRNCGKILLRIDNRSDTEVAEVTVQPRGAQYTDLDDLMADPTPAREAEAQTFSAAVKPGEEDERELTFCTETPAPGGDRVEFGFGVPECIPYHWITGYERQACLPEKLPGPYV